MWFPLRPTIAILAISAFAASGHSSRAAEAFLCGPQEILYVEREDLEHMKRTNACVAAHYGLTLDGDSDAEVEDAEEAARDPAGQPDAADTKPSGMPKTGRDRPHFRSLTEQPKTAAKATAVAAIGRTRAPVEAAPDTDYRNVRVLNAQDEADAWYRHAQ